MTNLIEKNFQTERLKLEQLKNEDAKFVCRLTNTKGWLKFIGDRDTKTIRKTVHFIEKTRTNPNSFSWKATLLKNNKPIGVISLIKRDYLDEQDIGFAFLPEYGAKGYAFESAKVILDSLFTQSETQNICAITQSNNKPSINLLKKLGFEKASEINIDMEELDVYSVSFNQIAINNLIDNFFKIFNNKNNRIPEWEKINEICIPNALIIKKEGIEIEYIYTLNSFIEPRKIILTNGTLLDFEEFEIAHETTINENIACRVSKYQKKGRTK